MVEIIHRIVIRVDYLYKTVNGNQSHNPVNSRVNVKIESKSCAEINLEPNITSRQQQSN